MNITPRTIAALTISLSVAAFTVGCSEGTADLTSPESSSDDVARASLSGDRCENVLVEGDAALGLIEVAPGVFTLGAIPFGATVAGVSGMLGSVVTGLETSGSKGQGAQHLTLVHRFISPQGTFTTTDRAVCAVAGKNAGTCRVNDVLSVVNGTGVFANAGGSLRNHGVIDLTASTLSISLRGRVCGDGV